MIVIREEQIDTLIKQIQTTFHGELLVHVKNFFPDITAEYEDKVLLQHIRKSLDRAKTYQLTTERDLYKYVNITMIYGHDFDEKTEHGWMKEYLTDTDVPNPSQRLSRLYEEILERLERDAKNKRFQREYGFG